MILSYTTGRNLFGSLSNDSSTATLAIADVLINSAIHEVINRRSWPFREKSVSFASEASTGSYDLYGDVGKIISVTVTNGTTVYTPIQITSRKDWDVITASTTPTTNYPQYFFVWGGQAHFWPSFSDATSTITLHYTRLVKDLSVADYTTGTIVTATLGSTAIVGSGTSWTAGMKGKLIRITSTSAANVGDGVWYEIASVSSATGITLEKPYAGVSIAAGSASYTIADSSIIPEAYQILPIYRALELYYASIQPEPSRAEMYGSMFESGMKQMEASELYATTDPSIERLEYPPIVNPNLMPTA